MYLFFKKTEKFLYKIRFYTVREQTSKVLLTAICSHITYITCVSRICTNKKNSTCTCNSNVVFTCMHILPCLHFTFLACGEHILATKGATIVSCTEGTLPHLIFQRTILKESLQTLLLLILINEIFMYLIP